MVERTCTACDEGGHDARTCPVLDGSGGAFGRLDAAAKAWAKAGTPTERRAARRALKQEAVRFAARLRYAATKARKDKDPRR